MTVPRTGTGALA